MALEPLHYAAIGAGGIAILVVLIYLIHRHRRRRGGTSRSTNTISTPLSNQITPKTTGSSGGLGGFTGYPQTSSNGHTDPDSPSSTPSPGGSGGRLKKSNSAPRQFHHHRPPAPAMPQPEEEDGGMVMVTYEEGLKKLGLDRAQHVIYPDPPSFELDTPGLSSSSSRPTPTTAQLLSPSKSGRRAAPGDSPLRQDVSLRNKIGRTDDSGRFPTDSEIMTGVPSYYHQTTVYAADRDRDRIRPISPPSAYSGTR